MSDFFYHIVNYMRSGGIVMGPILLLSFGMWILIFNRILFMHRLYKRNLTREEAGRLVKTNQMPDPSFKGVNSILVKEFLRLRSHDRVLDDYILDETVLKLTARMDQYLSIITMLSAMAPLLGLLGTVVGMMNTFDVITIFGTGNARAMSAGISVALITTQTGLMISIPGLYMSGWLRKRAQNLKGRIAATGLYVKRYL